MEQYAEGGLNISPLPYMELSPAFEGSGRIAEGRRVELQNAETDVGYFFLDRIYRARRRMRNARKDVGYFFLDRIYRIIRISVIP